MFRGQRTAVLCHDLETWFVWDKKDEASGFTIGIGFAEPTVTQLTTDYFQGKSPRWAGVIRKRSTDPSKPGRRVLGRG